MTSTILFSKNISHLSELKTHVLHQVNDLRERLKILFGYFSINHN